MSLGQFWELTQRLCLLGSAAFSWLTYTGQSVPHPATFSLLTLNMCYPRPPQNKWGSAFSSSYKDGIHFFPVVVLNAKREVLCSTASCTQWGWDKMTFLFFLELGEHVSFDPNPPNPAPAQKRVLPPPLIFLQPEQLMAPTLTCWRSINYKGSLAKSIPSWLWCLRLQCKAG